MKTLEIPPANPCAKGYSISFERPKTTLNLPKEEWEYYEILYDKVQEDPRKHFDALVEFSQRHPNVPEIANLLAFVLLRLKRAKEAEALIEKTYRDHPQYLIARINYADQCLRKKKIARIPEIFQGCFDLHGLCPKKESFHYAEFRGFMTVMGFYHMEIGALEEAEEYYQLAFQVDPLHPSVTALETRLFKASNVKKILKALQRLALILKKQ